MIAPSQGIHLVLDRAFLPGDGACWSRGPTTAGSSSRSPGTTDVSSARPTRPSTATAAGAAAAAAGGRIPARHAARYLTRDPRPERRPERLRRAPPAGPTCRSDRHRPALPRARGRRLGLGPGHDHRRQVDDLPPMGATPSTVPAVAGLPNRPCVTADLRLHGWTRRPAPLRPEAVMGPIARALAGARRTPGWDRPLHPGLPYRRARWPGRPGSSWHGQSRMSSRGGPVPSSSMPEPARRPPPLSPRPGRGAAATTPAGKRIRCVATGRARRGYLLDS